MMWHQLGEGDASGVECGVVNWAEEEAMSFTGHVICCRSGGGGCYLLGTGAAFVRQGRR